MHDGKELLQLCMSTGDNSLVYSGTHLWTTPHWGHSVLIPSWVKLDCMSYNIHKEQYLSNATFLNVLLCNCSYINWLFKNYRGEPVVGITGSQLGRNCSAGLLCEADLEGGSQSVLLGWLQVLLQGTLWSSNIDCVCVLCSEEQELIPSWCRTAPIGEVDIWCGTCSRGWMLAQTSIFY